MSESYKGKPHAAQTKQKIGTANRGRSSWKKGKKLNRETGQYE